ncbi:hypothetical protein BV378_37240 [Nostoc sp. RF31YmG]|jgi:hypothetical protein|nr:hypothetical protein BV378_37240 [Nostoc sp. RF31YmG]
MQNISSLQFKNPLESKFQSIHEQILNNIACKPCQQGALAILVANSLLKMLGMVNRVLSS